MASPSTSSSTASPHPGPSSASSAPQASGFAQAIGSHYKDHSFLEATPITYPTIVPLEWSFPLIHHPLTETTTDSSTLKNPIPITVSSAEGTNNNANIPSWSQSLPSRVPANVYSDVGPATPSTIQPVPSPANAASLATAGQAINQIQKPWRIIWASYVAKQPDSAIAGENSTNPTSRRNSKGSVRSTPLPDFLQVPLNQASNSPSGPSTPVGATLEKTRLMGRDRAASDASRRSSNSRASGHRHKKKRTHETLRDVEEVSPNSLLEAIYGEEHKAQYKHISDTLRDHTRYSKSKPFLDAKKRFLRSASLPRTADSIQDMQVDQSGSSAEDSILQHGRLPQRLAIVDPGRPVPANSKALEKKEDISRLYTFAMTSPDLDLSEYTSLDSNAYPGIELEASGTFTASDLFPSLFNDNGIYTSPSSMHPASIHPIPSAAALGPGQSPFFLSSLNISSSSNQEAIAASEAYLRAAEAHVLSVVQKTYNPDKPAQNVTEEHQTGMNVPHLSAYGEGVHCGHGLLYPNATPESTSDSQYVSSNLIKASESSPSPFLSCLAHFTPADIRVSIQVQNTSFKYLSDERLNAKSPPLLLNKTCTQVKKTGQVVLLCPVGVPAVLLRWYGETVNTVSRKQAAAEKSFIADTAPDLANLLQNYGYTPHADLAGERWALCALGSGLEIAWPISLILCNQAWAHHTSRRSIKSNKKRVSPRIRSAMARTSKRLCRKLYFQPSIARGIDLAETTVSHIEYHNREKVKDRRDRAKEVLASQRSGTESSQTEINNHSQNPSLTPSDPVQRPREEEPVVLRPDVNVVEPERNIHLTNAYGCPTFGSISAALDILLGPDVESPLPTSDQPSILVGNNQSVSPNNSRQVQAKASDVTAVYPTPQSVPNSTNQASIGTAYSIDANDGGQPALSPGDGANRALADIFQDFAWPNYMDTGLAPSQQPQSRPVSAGGLNPAYSTKGVFDNSSTFDLFDSGGLTEEDFSFFDSPTPVDMPTLSSTIAILANSHTAKLPEITADDIASFVNTAGPIDHFSHLMPRGNYDIQQALNTVKENNIALVGDSAMEPTESSHQQASCQEERAQLHEDQSEMELSGQDDAPEPGIPLKYDLSILGNPEDQNSRHGQALDTEYDPSRSMEAAFGPIHFLLPSPPPSDETEFAFDCNNDMPANTQYLRAERQLRAAKVRHALSKQMPGQLNSEDRFHRKRDWQEAEQLVTSSSESSVYASSDDSQDEETKVVPLRLERARSPKPSGMLPIDSLFELFRFHCPPLKSQHLAIKAPQNRVKETKESPVKINRGEKEAVATIFFQHTIENIDFRERQPEPISWASSLVQLSLAQPILPVPTLSRKLVTASATEITAYHQGAVTTMSISALKAWSKLGLKPHNGPKDIQAIVIAPKLLLDEDIHSTLGNWLGRIRRVWKSHGFGEHSAEPVEDSIFALDCSAATFGGSANLQVKLAELNSLIYHRIAGEHGCIIYVLVDDSECQTPSCNLMYLCLRLHLLRKGAIPHIVPLSLLASGSDCIPAYENGLLQDSVTVRFAFNVYDRLHTCVTRYSKEKKGPNSVSALLPEAIPSGGHLARAFVAPAFQLVSHAIPQVALQLQWPPPALDVMDANRLFHVAYEVSHDRKWLYLSAVDDRAEYNCLRVRFIEGLELRLILRRIWNFLREASECASLEWRVCISRLGTMSPEELQAWCEILQNGVHQLARPCLVTICTVGQTGSSTSELSPLAPTPQTPSGTLNGMNMANAPDIYHVEGQPPVYISHSPYPAPIYDRESETLNSLPSLPEKIYYNLASSSLYFPRGDFGDERLNSHAFHAATASYRIDLLAAAAHPLSSYNRQLSSHMSDLAQSFVDLYVLARERWAATPYTSRSDSLTHLPWHLASVSHMPSFELDSLLPS